MFIQPVVDPLPPKKLKKAASAAFFVVSTNEAVDDIIDPARIGKVTYVWYALTAIGKNKLACYFEWGNVTWAKQFSLLVQALGLAEVQPLVLLKKGIV
ncbi:hypothetical protein [Niallia endozanthoxylica]|uniref:Uncharacterized protein n=1 Tax=Niallia endozanthoxylica TaxID=2036016 RepID=A0A5J5HN66_9BACI|nr:hypothetical protein [Niallia endozanthoxylica]KAA9022892.1 hypothetical protein F4V44_14215 [Niallia endozanthoxylica]